MEIIEVKANTISVLYNGQPHCINYVLNNNQDKGDIPNFEYIFPGDIYYSTSESTVIFVGDTRIAAMQKVLERFVFGEDRQNMLHKLMNIDEYILFSEICQNIVSSKSSDFVTMMNEMIAGSRYEMVGRSLSSKQAMSFSIAWLSKVVFRDVFLLGYSASSLIFGKGPGIRDVCEATFMNKDLLYYKNNPLEIYGFYWMSFKLIQLYENVLGLTRDRYHYSMYNIASKIFNAYRFNNKYYLTQHELLANPGINEIILNSINHSTHGFSKTQNKETQQIIYYLNFTLDVPARVIHQIENCHEYIFENDIEQDIMDYENLIFFSFDEDQISAIINAVTSPDKVVTINGMPGTGKSTVIGCIVYILEKYNKNIKLFTPTGKSSARLNEIVTELNLKSKSSTCHMFFCTGKKKKYLEFCMNYNNILDVIIFDETSMISFNMLRYTLHGISFSKIIFVGDIDQIPCVEDVGCFQTMISKYNSNKLLTVHRNKFKDFNTEFLNNSKLQVCLNYPEIMTVNLIESEQRTADMFIYMMSIYHSDKFNQIFQDYNLNSNYDGYSNCIITYRNETRERLTQIIRQKLGYYSDYNVGEPMIILKNDYDNNVMNGDIFIIVGDNGNTKKCHFPKKNKTIMLDMEFIKSKTYYAYVITFHKSQASEWEYVIIYIDSMERSSDGKTQFLDRNLIYTGVNRPKKHCYIQIANTFMLNTILQPSYLLDYNNFDI